MRGRLVFSLKSKVGRCFDNTKPAQRFSEAENIPGPCFLPLILTRDSIQVRFHGEKKHQSVEGRYIRMRTSRPAPLSLRTEAANLPGEVVKKNMLMTIPDD